MKEIHRPNQEQLASLETHVESSNRPIRWKTDGTTREQRVTGFPDIDGRSVGVHELEATIFIPVRQFVLGVPVLLGVLAWLVGFLFLVTIGSSEIKEGLI